MAARDALLQAVPDETVRAVGAKFGLDDRRYVLAGGSLEPRKNLPRLIAAFALLAREPDMGDVRLVLAGARQRGAGAVEAAVSEHGLTDKVVLTGFVTDAELAALMRGAACFAYVSLYEGFGLPVLEAMAQGPPVVTSKVSSLPEVAGDAALLVDPYDPESIADGMRRVLTDANLAASLREKGAARAGTFSWERTAAEHVRVYREVAG